MDLGESTTLKNLDDPATPVTPAGQPTQQTEESTAPASTEATPAPAEAVPAEAAAAPAAENPAPQPAAEAPPAPQPATPAPAPQAAAPAPVPTPSTPVEMPEVLPVLQAGQPIRVQSQQPTTYPIASRQSSPTSGGTITKTDTSVGPPRTTELPNFATPSPYVPAHAPDTGDLPFSASGAPPSVTGGAIRDGYSSDLNAKSKAFNQRVDYMIGEFFSRQVSKFATSTPETVDRNYRIFQQKMKEKLGQQWAHITAQPEVDDAVKQVQVMHEYFTFLEKLVEKQRSALQMLHEVEAELSLFYQQKGYQEELEDIGRNLVHLGVTYNNEGKERQPLLTSLEAFLAFIKTFNSKAIGDSLDTIKRQATARQELDSYGSKLGALEEKRLKNMAKTPTTAAGQDAVKYQEKDLVQTRERFQAAKDRYQNLSTQVIDKAGLLEMKRGVDFASYLDKLVEATDAYSRSRITAQLAQQKANGVENGESSAAPEEHVEQQ
ncbi:hypothetical protein HDV00_006233 [Rhizophlyctis rosea]|nr:hypothetical protein HDV00_006233 [Rhizophlyctis rosea]